METTIGEHDGRMIARIDDSDRVFEVAFDTIEPTDVTLRFIRDDDRVGSIHNDDSTHRGNGSDSPPEGTEIQPCQHDVGVPAEAGGLGRRVVSLDNPRRGGSN